MNSVLSLSLSRLKPAMPIPQQIRSTRICLGYPQRSALDGSLAQGEDPLRNPQWSKKSPIFKMKCQSRDQRIELRVS